MFGYVRPHKAELKLREYERYKAVYCELCRELGKSFGIGARFILNYDCTFYAMTALSLSDSELAAVQKRCTMNPLKHCGFLKSEGDEYKKAAALSVIMTYYKFKDNIQDESFFKSLAARLGKAFLSRKYRKAQKLYPFLDDVVTEAMGDQEKAESDKNSSIDSCCDPTAKMLSRLLSELAPVGDNGSRLALSEFGYYFGRWIYTMDAADDLAEDLRTGSFNPFIRMLGLEEYAKGKEPKSFEGEIKEEAELVCNEVLNRNVAGMLLAFNLLEAGRFGEILENIINLGLPEIQREILFMHIKERKKGIEKSVLRRRDHDRSV